MGHRLGIEDDILFFERVPTLRLLGREALRVIAIGAETRYVHKGEVLFVAGDVADGGYVIQAGSFKLEIRSKLAADVIVGAGTLLGELALVTETKRPATATASEPSTVVRIPRTLFLKMMEGYPEAAGVLREQIVRRAQETLKDMSDVRALLDASQAPQQ
jgi:CRP-like cAMP-binding protein